MATRVETWRDRLLADLRARYEQRFPRSLQAQERALRYLVDGGSHTMRLYDPFPFRAVSAQGSRVRDLDGHEIIDYWQGHYANILGHNPALVTAPLSEAMARGHGLQTGLPEEAQTDLAELLLARTGDERVRFTTAGSLATMYCAIMARAFTGRTMVVKVAGGWHGAQPLALRGTRYGEEGFGGMESQGLPADSASQTVVTRYNDLDDLHAVFRRHGEQVACFIIEPCLGTSGFIPAHPEYLRTVRELTWRYGALLICDEIISGFRFCAAGLQKLYGVQADLSTYGKIVGGGMPVSAVTGRADVMALAGKATGRKVLFEGGTFSAHPASMLAGKLMIEHLVRHESTTYPQLAEAGERLRAGLEKVFADHGMLARCTGRGNEVVPGSSLIQVHFPCRDDLALEGPEALWDPLLCDAMMRERVLRLGLLLRDVNVSHGLGALSTAHSEADLAQTLEAFDWLAGEVARARGA
ncbi:MAG: aminotransferase class III-fold pyridoxal phosphate-dependent enzyme [Anaerolineae bacterium]|nr:aminotransferase class III-fold pyridoxal phosphate-dependent enzyme [Anaerolineae bacterium]